MRSYIQQNPIYTCHIILQMEQETMIDKQIEVRFDK